MTQINTMKYRYQCCPFCKSKRIKAKQLHDPIMNNNTNQPSGYLCLNCNRYHPMNDTIYKVDRAEIRRDINRLQKELGGCKKPKQMLMLQPKRDGKTLQAIQQMVDEANKGSSCKIEVMRAEDSIKAKECYAMIKSLNKSTAVIPARRHEIRELVNKFKG